MILKFYSLSNNKYDKLTNSIKNLELCYYVGLSEELTKTEIQILKWILTSPFVPGKLTTETLLRVDSKSLTIVEIGPRLNFSTAFSSNAVSICQAAGLNKITRLEVGKRYLIECNSTTESQIVDGLHDRMTECRYREPIETFDHGYKPEPWFPVDVLKHGKKALEDVNSQLGLAFDDWDLNFYTNMFVDGLKRNPTSVECFDLAQSNSEHSRHWFFKGRMILDGKEMEKSLLDNIVDTQNYSNGNNVVKFSDNSSAIVGYKVPILRPVSSFDCSWFEVEELKQDLIFTAETHNFPTGIAPFSGATTGTGGRLRDVQSIGRGGNYIAGTVGYSVGNLLIPGYDLPWETQTLPYPSNMASPLEILIQASNGASDYGNKFGEPLILGYSRSFGILEPPNTRREYIKPIMFSGGLGTIDSPMIAKLPPKPGMEVIKIGGPVYRIGVGGGSASSVKIQGDNSTALDFNAVQRGDPEMEQKLNRLVRACLEMGDKNPILSIHDQGAGGNGNVLKELVEPAGAIINTEKFKLGDPSINTLELWGAEYQENNAILCNSEDIEVLELISKREKCPLNIVGKVTGDGRMILREENGETPVDLDLKLVLGKIPRKTFDLKREERGFEIIKLPNGLNVGQVLDRVLRLPGVGSKRYLTNKVDRCVTGLVAQQQCVGPLHTPLADVGVVAISYFDFVGIASSIGEQPIKGIINPSAGARMSVAEALSNLVFAKISSLGDVKCSGNWMWAAKLPGEGADLYEACTAMCSLMKDLGIAVDGGKDSLSMAARVGAEIVKSPGTLVISTYAPCPDIRKIVTPDLKSPSQGKTGCLIHVDLSNGKNRLGGTALAQVYNNLGNQVPDVEDSTILKNAFNVIQSLINDKKILSGHDISDGGLLTCILEMSFAGISGLKIDLIHKTGNPIEILFAEEIGWVLEIDKENLDFVMTLFDRERVPVYKIGESLGFGMNSKIVVKVNREEVLNEKVISLMRKWEETSFRLEKRQSTEDCAIEEFEGLGKRSGPEYKLNFDPDLRFVDNTTTVRVAVIREEGINGDREMVAALVTAGFQVWDVTMQDLLEERVSLERFRGIVFPGGFSYADVFGSAKGWAASLLFHPALKQQLQKFIQREDSFSLGICNGCQLMTLLGFVGTKNEIGETDIILDRNKSARFECRWSTIKIEPSPCIWFKGMENSVLGVWIAHGEGRFTFRDEEVLEKLKKNHCLPVRFTNDVGEPTEVYPFNPNGSIDGIAGICSPNGRHLSMMPHPERSTLPWQSPYQPSNWKSKKFSPWQRMFDNAYNWCNTKYFN